MSAPRANLHDWLPPENVTLSHVVTRIHPDGWEFEGYFSYRRRTRIPGRSRLAMFSVSLLLPFGVEELEASGALAATFTRACRARIRDIEADDADFERQRSRRLSGSRGRLHLPGGFSIPTGRWSAEVA